MPDARHEHPGDQQDGGGMAELYSAQKQSHQGDRNVSEGRAEIGLLQDQKHWHTGDQAGLYDVRQRCLAFTLTAEILGQHKNQNKLDPLRRLEVLPAWELNPPFRAQIFFAEESNSQQRHYGSNVKPVGIFQQDLIVDEAHGQHHGQPEHDPVNLPDVCSGKLGAIGGAVNLQHAKRADQQDKGEQQPVKVAKRDQPPHQSDPAKPIDTGRAALRILVLPSRTTTVPPWSSLLFSATSFSATSAPRSAWAFAASAWAEPIASGWFHTPAIGTEPGSALSLNSIGLLRSRRCFST